ncbi:MAG: hypothetical protein ABJ333_02910 [Algoriphagus sp.]
MNNESDYGRKQEDLTWLENLQRNSWEPEVIISGITLAFLFVFPAKVYEFSAYLIQEVGTGYIVSWLILIYLTTVVNVFKIFFVAHLALRFVWAGLLGLSFAFPEGVIHQRLFKSEQGFNYQNPNEMVLKLERICSTTFAYPVSMLITFLIITIYLGLLIFVYVLFDLPFIVLAILTVLTLLAIIFSSFIFKKKSKLKKWFAGTILNSISAIYQSNLGKWFTLFYAVGIFLCATPLIFNDVEDFSMFVNESNLIEKELEWPSKAHIFEDYHDETKRYPRAFIPSEVLSDDVLQLGVSRYEDDAKMVDHIQREFNDQLASLGWHEVNQSSDLLRLYIDEEVVENVPWSKVRLPMTGQKIYQSLHFIEDLPSGTHTLRVEKLILSYDLVSNKPEIKKLQNWAKFEFIKR